MCFRVCEFVDASSISLEGVFVLFTVLHVLYYVVNYVSQWFNNNNNNNSNFYRIDKNITTRVID